jgi:single-strand DNA-binding protein
MSGNFNQIALLGNLGKDPEFNFTPKGKAICKCSLAVNEKSGDTNKTTWFNLIFWEKLAEIAEKYLEKGSQVLIVGRMCCDEYTDKEGKKGRSWYVTVSQMQMIGDKRESKPAAASNFDPLEDVGFNPF